MSKSKDDSMTKCRDLEFGPLSRREVLRLLTAITAAASSGLSAVHAATAKPASRFPPDSRFPYFKTTPVSYRCVKLQDTWWAPRQKLTREVTIDWIARAHDEAGGLEAFRAHSQGYEAGDGVVNMEAIKHIEAMSTAVGLQRDKDIEGLIDAWVRRLVQAQGSDGYLEEHFPPGLDHPEPRWKTWTFSHEAYTTGHYIESAIAYQESTGKHVMYDSAVRAADNMADALLGGQHAYTSGHPEIEQALMRLYGESGDSRYLELCGWLLNARGRHEGRPNYGRNRIDDRPLTEQREIEGHAVMAAFLWNGVTQYVGATGDASYREAVVSVWDDFANRRMYIHGGGGNRSSKNEGYRRNAYCILPDDAYAESCSVFANFQWSHSLARLTGEARYIDVAERMLYNAFYASLSMTGDAAFYSNPIEVDVPTPRLKELATSCCPPNIVKLFNKVGGFFYSTDADGIYVNHYGESEAHLPWGGGVTVIQRTQYPWNGDIDLEVKPTSARRFTMRLRVPGWARSHAVSVNGKPIDTTPSNGWVSLNRFWKPGDRIVLELPLEVRRVTMPPQFEEYENRAALERGPVVYCLEEQDLESPSVHWGDAATGDLGTLQTLYIPAETTFVAEHRSDFLGGVTVLTGPIRQLKWLDDGERTVQATFIPYGVWGNRTPGPMRVWLGARKAPLVEMSLPQQRLGESCVG